MNRVIVPPSPNWYEDKILACAPDNTLVYGSRNDLIILEPNTDLQEAPNVRIVSRAHAQRVLSVSINRNWAPSKKFVASSDDKIVKVWNVETGQKLACHEKHVSDNRIAGVAFAGDDRVISVSDDGNIVIWNILNNETTVFKELFGMKVSITCISTCPHATWLTAFGLKSGLVIVADLRKNGKVLHKMRGHDKPVISLAWCPASINIFPKNPTNYVGQKSKKQTESKEGLETEMKLEVSQEPCVEATPHPLLKVYDSGDEDFLKECQVLKNKILGSHESVVDKIESAQGKDAGDQLHHIVDKSLGNLNSPPKVLEEPVEVVSKNTDSKQNLEAQSNNSEKQGTHKIGKESDLQIEEKSTECLNDCIEKAPGAQENKSESKEEIEGNISDKPKDLLENTAESGIKNEDNLINANINKDSLNNIKDNDDLEGTKSKDDKDDPKNCTELDKDRDSSKCDDKLAAETTETSNDSVEKVPEPQGSEEKIIDIISDKPKGLSENNVQSHDTELSIIKDKLTDTNLESDNKNNVEDNEESTKSKDSKVDSKTCSDVGRDIVKVISVEEAPRKEFLLASSAKENNIYIWRAGTDGRLQTFLTLPHKTNKYKTKAQLERIWISLCWATPTILLSSFRQSELLAWNLPKPKDESKLITTIHMDHVSLLFSIAAPLLLLNEYNWKDGPTATNAWTSSQDRLLINSSITADKKILSCYSTFGGNVSRMMVSPVDPHRLAVGTGDGHIKIWDLSRPHSKIISMTPFYQKIQSKVTALAWHPTNENILAFGTMEGRVGYIDPSNKSKVTSLLKQYFKSQIHSIEWAPMKGDNKNLGLYILSDGQLALYDPSSKKQELIPLEKANHTYLYSLSWLPDYSMMVTIAKSGHLIAYTPELNVICKHYFKYRLLEIVWHPEACNNIDAEVEGAVVNKYKNWFAAIANYHTIVVYKFEVESGNNDENIVNVYRGESDLIHSISWNPFEPSQLIMACDIGIAQVWDVETGEIKATYENTSYESVTAAIFSPVNPEYAISGGKENTISVWKIADHPQQEEKGIVYKRKKILKAIGKESSSLVPKEESEENVVKEVKDTKNHLLPKFYSSKDMQVVEDLRKVFKWKENQETEETDPERKLNDILNIFGTDEAMINLVIDNETTHKKRGKYNFSTLLSLFRGDLSTTIKEAIDGKRITPQIISLAPMVSPKLWQQACNAYAEQLSEERSADPLEIATYYLACHKVEEAVAVLCEYHLYREALALAKCRMMGKEAVDDIIEKWANSMKLDGNFENAAQCYIYLGRYEDAATVLYRRTDLHILQFLVELTEKIDNEELRKAAEYRYNSFKKAEEESTKQEVVELPSRAEALLHKQKSEGATNSESDVNQAEDKVELAEKKDEYVLVTAPNEDNDVAVNVQHNLSGTLPDINIKEKGIIDRQDSDQVKNSTDTIESSSKISDILDKNKIINDTHNGSSNENNKRTEDQDRSQKNDEVIDSIKVSTESNESDVKQQDTKNITSLNVSETTEADEKTDN